MWETSTKEFFATSLKMRTNAEKQTDLSIAAAIEVDNSNAGKHQETHRQLVQKVKNQQIIVDELSDIIRTFQRNTARMKNSLLNVQQAYMAKNAPLQLCTWRQDQRTRRPDRELVRDVLEEALDEEKEVLVSAQKRLKENGHRTENMLSTIGEIFADLQEDHSAKCQTLGIDEKCLRMMHRTWPHVPTGGLPKENPSSGDFAARIQQTEAKKRDDTRLRIEKARQQESKYTEMIAANDALVSQTTIECAEASKAVDVAMEKKIEQAQKLRRSLQDDILHTNHEMDRLVHTIALTQKEMNQGSIEALDLVNGRTKLRDGRHDREKFSDAVTAALTVQHATLKNNYAWLEKRQDAESQAMAELQKVKADLEADLSDKTYALHIDLDCQRRATHHFQRQKRF